MQSLRTLLLHVEDSDRMATRFDLAVELADRFDAQVDAHYAAMPSLIAPSAFGDGASAGIAAAMSARLDAERMESARARFDKARARSPRLHWVDADGTTYEALRRRAICSDLAILGQYEDGGAGGDQSSALVPELLARSGRPALVVPFAGPVAPVGQRVVVAWKPTAGSARALAAALPWLQRSRSVDVVSFGRDAKADLDDVARYLDRHGIGSTLHPWSSPEKDVGELLLSEVADSGADLLVMGSYGHTRLQEWILGGVTRTILASMTVPVLLMH
jgi:nucleotide-binding universal stress UspA family protein